MPTIQAIYRYPIKGLSPESLPRVEIEAGGPFPFDRVFALARPGAPIDPERPAWAKKGSFVMSMLDDGLGEIETRLDPVSLRLTAARGGHRVLEADLGAPEGRGSVEAFFRDHVPGLPAAPRLVRAAEGHFMDKPANWISLINLETLRSLEARWGFAIDPLRFRANLYVDGVAPWREFDWVGSELKIGGRGFRVESRNGRCAATNVDPVTGKRDLDIPGSLRRAFGHKDLGVYLRALESGAVAVGDAVIAPDAPAVPSVAASAPDAPATRRYICRGCYFIYDVAKGVPGQGVAPGTDVADLPAAYQCPDCGTDSGKLRVHGAAPGAP